MILHEDKRWQTIFMKYHTLFFRKLDKMSQDLSSAAVVIDALRVNISCFRLKIYNANISHIT